MPTSGAGPLETMHPAPDLATVSAPCFMLHIKCSKKNMYFQVLALKIHAPDSKIMPLRNRVYSQFRTLDTDHFSRLGIIEIIN